VTSGSQATRYTPSGEAGETRVRNMADEFCLRSIFTRLIQVDDIKIGLKRAERECVDLIQVSENRFRCQRGNEYFASTEGGEFLDQQIDVTFPRMELVSLKTC
jgi:hypothetical protein